MLTVICEHTGECLAVGAGRPIRSADVLEVLASLLVVRESGGQGAVHRAGANVGKRLVPFRWG